jgi:hypothetical protein
VLRTSRKSVIAAFEEGVLIDSTPHASKESKITIMIEAK